MPTHEQIERYRELLTYKWLCDQCDDGLPHKGMPHRHSRASQRLGSAYITAFITGRGWGKTRAAVEIIKDRMLAEEGHRVNVVAPTFGVGRDVTIEGESGVLGVIPKDRVANWNRSLGELMLKNGSQLKLFGAHTKDDAESIRGSQSHTLYFEELAQHRHAQLAWDNGHMANRLGQDPRVIITATPKNTPLIKKIFNDPEIDRRHGHTLENAANLAMQTVNYLREKYEGTRLGKQELEGLLLDDVAGALWTRDMFRPMEYVDLETLTRVVVAVDPPGSHRTRASAEAGILVVGKRDEFLFVLEDASTVATPEQWSTIAVDLYEKYEADAIIAERNFGGDMVLSTLRSAGMGGKVRMVSASRGKQLRAEPVVNLYERGKVFHVGEDNAFSLLETQMCGWVPPGQVETDENGVETPIEPSAFSPDRLDALVHAITDLALQPRRSRTVMTCKVPTSMSGVRR